MHLQCLRTGVFFDAGGVRRSRYYQSDQRGNEVSSFSFSFQQGINTKGKATTRVYSGTLHVTLSQLPDKQMIEWALNSRKYSDGIIIMLDQENIPMEKLIF